MGTLQSPVESPLSAFTPEQVAGGNQREGPRRGRTRWIGVKASTPGRVGRTKGTNSYALRLLTRNKVLGRVAPRLSGSTISRALAMALSNHQSAGSANSICTQQYVAGELAAIADVKSAVRISRKAPGVAADLRAAQFGVLGGIRFEQQQGALFVQYQQILPGHDRG